MNGLYIAVIAVAILLLVGAGIAAVALSRRKAPPAEPMRKPPPPPESGDDEVTIVGFAPMRDSDSEWADSEVTQTLELGSTRIIAYDPQAADDEQSGIFALMLVSAVGQSHKGRRRKRNEDRFLALARHNLFVVADGMGGYVGGMIAAQIAVDTMQLAFDANNFEGGAAPGAPRDGAQLAAAVQMANRAIFQRAEEEPELQGMGTTLVGARFSPRKERVYLCHVGDSRCYRLRDGTLEQLTVDHNLENEGITGKERHQLTRAVGIGPAVEVDLTLAQPEIGDRYLLCSDGLNKMLNDAQIRVLLNDHRVAERAVEQLIHQANEAGGRDNVTVIVIDVLAPGVGVVPHDQILEAEQAREAAENAADFAEQSAAAIDALARQAAAEMAAMEAAAAEEAARRAEEEARQAEAARVAEAMRQQAVEQAAEDEPVEDAEGEEEEEDEDDLPTAGGEGPVMLEVVLQELPEDTTEE